MRPLTTRRGFLVGGAASAAAFQSGSTAADPAIHVIRIKSFAFVPDRLEVRIGDTIRWTNEDLAPHTATADNFGWDTDALELGQSGEITVTADMETSYFCVFHPHMKGQISIV